MRIKLLVEYDGSAYCGWQAQENGPSIQGELEAALKKATGEECRIIGAGRTDAGVHALGQCAHFDTQARIPADKFSFVFNRFLPPDIRVKSSCQVPEDFHARKSARGKHYRYAIYNGRHNCAIGRQTCAHVPVLLQEDLMYRAGQYLVGKHDFGAFKAEGSNLVGTVRTVYALCVRRQGEMVYLDIFGDGFLYNMVRIIAGTLIDVGKRKYPPERVLEILHSRDRRNAGPTAVARGLCMVEVFYQEGQARREGENIALLQAQNAKNPLDIGFFLG